jgi:WD40 repeat protein
MQAVAWSPVEELLATGSVDGPVRIVDGNGATVEVLDHDPGTGVFDLAFSPDGRLLAAAIKQAPDARWDPAVHRVLIWDWRERKVVTTIRTSSVGIAFDPSGERLATSNVEEGKAEVWDVATGERLTVLSGHSGGVSDVSWHPDPERDQVATASGDGTVRLWDASSGLTQLVLRGHASPVWQVAFAPDGLRLASSSEEAVRVWTLGIDELTGIARAKLTRDLTDAECLEFLHLAACP